LQTAAAFSARSPVWILLDTGRDPTTSMQVEPSWRIEIGAANRGP